MSVTEYERNQLFAWFEEHMGKERAAAMMNLLPPIGWGDVAMKRDLDVVVERIDARFERVDARFDRVDARFEQVDARFEQVDARFVQVDARFEQMDARFEQMDARFDAMDAKFEGLEARFQTLDGKVDHWVGQMASKSDIEALRSDLQRTFITWILTAQATVVAAVVGLAAVLS